MDPTDPADPKTAAAWDAAFGRLLELIPRGKKAAAFGDANYVEVVAKKALNKCRQVAASAAERKDE